MTCDYLTYVDISINCMRESSKFKVKMGRWMVVMVMAGMLSSMLADVNIMKDVTLGFGQALQHCREESQLTEEKMEEFFHFWRDDFKFEDRALGCAILCMSKHFNLMTDSARMHHQKTDEFIKSFPNGEKISQMLVQFIHTCEKEYDAVEDHCDRILRVAECFKASCKKKNMAPEMELLLAEFIMESDGRRR